MRKIKRPKIGEYALVTEWRDKDPRDPWRIGFVKALVIYKGGIRFRVDNDIREYKHCWRISEEEGRAWIETHLTLREPDSLKAGDSSLPDVVKSESNLPA